MEWATTTSHSLWRPGRTMIPQDYLCKWCLTYVGNRRLFCSADCAAQFRICQKRRQQRQDLNISVDYYGNVKLCVQGLPLISHEDIAITVPPEGVRRTIRRRKRCRYCSRLLKGDNPEEFCDDTCEEMEAERTKREEFINIFQQKEAAERRRIRKWLLDAQDQYSKMKDELPPISMVGDDIKIETGTEEREDVVISEAEPGTTSAPPQINKSSPVGPNVTPRRRLPGQKPTRRLNFLGIDEAVIGGPVRLNPIPLRKAPFKHDRRAGALESDRRQLMIDLKWIPKFYG